MKNLLKIILPLGLILLLTGCDVSQNLDTPTTTKPKIDDNLPVVDKNTIKAIPDMTSIALEWGNISNANIFGYYIYRSNIQKDGEQMTRIATIKSRYASHFVDTHLQPSTQYLYTISTIGKKGVESRPSDSISFKTFPLFDSVSLIDAISNLPRQVKIIWRPHTNKAVKSYILERNTPAQANWKKIATLKNRLIAEYIDTNLKDGALYMYRLKAVTFDGIISKPSVIVKATTKTLPNNVTNIEATKNQPRKIILTWTPSIQKDIVSYKVYVSNSADGIFKLLKNVPKDDNTLEHTVNKDNKMKFYKITTVDKDGLESDIKLLPVVMGKTLNAPLTPTITLAQIQGGKVILNWVANDKRTISYNIYKTVSKNYFENKTKVFKEITNNRFEDTDVVRGVTYKYSIEAVDENGLVSAKTPEVSLSMPKIEQPQPTSKKNIKIVDQDNL